MKNSKKFLQTAIVYVRSFRKESINIHNLDEQEKAITEFASENGYRILKVFREENESAKSFDRPQFQKMMEYIKSNKWKVKFLIVSDISRLSRDTSGFYTLKRFLRLNGIKLISIVESMLRYTGKQAGRHR